MFSRNQESYVCTWTYKPRKDKKEIRLYEGTKIDIINIQICWFSAIELGWNVEFKIRSFMCIQRILLGGKIVLDKQFRVDSF